jgi:hypothetical protein
MVDFLPVFLNKFYSHFLENKNLNKGHYGGLSLMLAIAAA